MKPTMAMIQCAKCKVLKLRVDFYRCRAKKGGLQSYCIECCGAYRVKPSRERYNTYKRTYRLRHRVKDLARAQVHNSIKRGVLVKLPCEVCGSSKVEAHHCDYLKPLDVMWLCNKHHSLWHRHLKAYDEDYRPEDDELVEVLMNLRNIKYKKKNTTPNPI